PWPRLLLKYLTAQRAASPQACYSFPPRGPSALSGSAAVRKRRSQEARRCRSARRAAIDPSSPRLPARSTRTSRTLTPGPGEASRSEEHTSELQSRENPVCRLLLEKKNQKPARAP